MTTHNRPPLSPDAQAVLDAFNREARPEPHHQREAIAAALRAAADHVETVAPWVGHIESAGVHWSICELKSIAAELEAQP